MTLTYTLDVLSTWLLECSTRKASHVLLTLYNLAPKSTTNGVVAPLRRNLNPIIGA